MEISTYKLDDGTLVYLDSDGKEYTPLSALSGLFSADGFFDKVIKTASGAFKKADGTNTFFGNSANTIVNALGRKIATQVGQQGSINNGMFTPTIIAQNPFQQPSQLPFAINANPFPDGKKPISPGLIVAGVLGVVGLGAGVMYAIKNKGK
jgi:hypothetical protein